MQKLVACACVCNKNKYGLVQMRDLIYHQRKRFDGQEENAKKKN
jgi:hypothetical protein